jgi:hypothetical protein
MVAAGKEDGQLLWPVSKSGKINGDTVSDGANASAPTTCAAPPPRSPEERRSSYVPLSDRREQLLDSRVLLRDLLLGLRQRTAQ